MEAELQLLLLARLGWGATVWGDPGLGQWTHFPRITAHTCLPWCWVARARPSGMGGRKPLAAHWDPWSGAGD